MDLPATNGIVRSLENDVANTTTTVGESSNSDLLPRDLLEGEDLTGICECGTCTVSTFLQHIPCPRPSQVPALSLPFLDLLHMDATQRSHFLGNLYLEYKAVSNRLSSVRKDTYQVIARKKMTLAALSRVLAKLESFMPSLPQDEKATELKKSKTINQLFTLLPDQSSFLNYHIFEDLAAQLKDSELKESVAAYKRILEVYCKRGVFECPSYAPTGKTGHSNFIVELDKSRCSMTIHELLVLQEQLCGVMGVVPNTLTPCSVSKMQNGNLQIVFMVPTYVKDVLTPLNPEQEKSLRELGFLNWSFYSGMDITYDPAQLANQLLATHNSTTNHQDTSENQQVDGEAMSDDDEEDELPRKKLLPAPGKKTRGRVKIPMEYIKNKLRRYTTFSKRKSNIMKKAYELSTLTGTQVMLMVASETGHVYTFATPKLQPMITSEAGKALIQTCLHQPDPATTSTSAESTSNSTHRVRMSSSGYEETDLGGYLPPGTEDRRNKAVSASSSSAGGAAVSSPPLIPSTSSTVNHRMPSIYNPPPPSLPPSLANELLPTGILQSLVTSSSSSHSPLLPPPLISPESYSAPGVVTEEVERGGEGAMDNSPPSP